MKKSNNTRIFFDGLIDFLNDFESGLVNLIAKIVPLMVPLIPAYVSYQHVIKELEFLPIFAWTYAAVVEGLGYASVYKALQFWEWNRHYTKDENKSPVALAVGIYIAYLFVILWVNVMLDWQTGVAWYRIIAVGAISLLSVPAGLLVSISAIHTERVREKDERKQEQKDRRQEEKDKKENRPQAPQENAPQPQTKKRPGELVKEYMVNALNNENRLPEPKEIQDAYGLNPSTVYYAYAEFVVSNQQELFKRGYMTADTIEKYVLALAKQKKVDPSEYRKDLNV